MGTQRVGSLETSARGQIGRRICSRKIDTIGKKNNIYCMVILQLVSCLILMNFSCLESPRIKLGSKFCSFQPTLIKTLRIASFCPAVSLLAGLSG